jgi:hypothetical protein
MARHNKFTPDRTFKKDVVTSFFGFKCQSPDCKWWDEETKSYGCRDIRGLQVDHIKGGGTEDREIKGRADTWAYVFGLITKKEVSHEYIRTYYQLLCGTCNWIKRHVNNEIALSKHPLITRQDIKDLGVKPVQDIKRTIDELRSNPTNRILVDELIRRGAIKLEDK